MARGKSALDKYGLSQMDREMLAIFTTARASDGSAQGSAKQAYQKTHPKSSPATAEKHAKEWLKKPAIVAAINRISEQAQHMASCTMADHLIKLAELRDSALGGADYGAAIKAEELRGKAAGHYIEKHKHELTGKDGGAISITETADPMEVARRVAFTLAKGMTLTAGQSPSQGVH